MISADAEELRALAGALASLGDAEDILDALAAYEQRKTQERFSRGVDPQGKAWQPLTPKYARAKARRGRGSAGINLNTGALSRSVRAFVEGADVVVGGGAAHASRVQALRPFLGFDAEDTELASIISTAVEKAFDAAA